jgi:AraC family transcriptional regulator
MAVARLPSEFYGFRNGGLQVRGFEIHAMAASGDERHVPVHTHLDAHFVLVLSGRYITSARGGTDAGRSPALVFNPPGTTHRDRFHGGVGSFVTISLSDDRFTTCRDEYAVAAVATRLWHPHAQRAAFGIARELRVGRDALVLESMALELVGAAGRITERVDGSPGWIRRAYETLMDGDPSVKLGIGAIAADAGVHPVHLARAFRQTWGCSPGELLRWRRIDRACDLLRSSELSAAAIASDVGFVDQSHMNRAFRAEFGLTPGAYRRAHVAPIQDARRDN